MFFFFIKCIGVTLVNKSYRFQMHVSMIHDLHVAACPPPSQIISRHHVFGPIYPLLLPTSFPLGTTVLLSVSEFHVYLSYLFTF